MENPKAIILAAGDSKRMGSAKAKLGFNGNYTFLDQLLSQYEQAGIKDIMVVSQYENLEVSFDIKSRVSWLKNNEPQKGRAWSIFMALSKLGYKAPVFIQNIDNPFTSTLLLNKMMDSADPHHSVVPVYQLKKGHPVLLPPNLLQLICQQDFTSFDFKESMKTFPSFLLAWNHQNILANINSPEDYHRWVG